MAIFVLISGAWHAGWCWERIVAPLEASGHQVLAPDLAGMGEDPTLLGGVSLGLWADQIAELIVAQKELVILVGHSRGGAVISAVAERIPGHIAWLAYVAAFLVPAGDTLMSMASRSSRDSAVDFLEDLGDGTTMVRREALGPIFYNCTSPEWVDRALKQLSPEPNAVAASPLTLTEQHFGSVPRAYIECTQDNALPIELQRFMQSLQPCDPVFTLDTDHSPFYSSPEPLTNCLLKLARLSSSRSIPGPGPCV